MHGQNHIVYLIRFVRHLEIGRQQAGKFPEVQPPYTVAQSAYFDHFLYSSRGRNSKTMLQKTYLHIIHFSSLTVEDFTSSVCCPQDRLPACPRMNLVMGLPP